MDIVGIGGALRADRSRSGGGGAMDGLAEIDEAIAAIRVGGMAIVVDDPDRENEGDLVMAADRITAAHVNFMATRARGLICVSMALGRLTALGVPPMASASTDPKGTAFHVSVDHRVKATTGISASDRAHTIRALADPDSRGIDFTQPGHVFPLAAREGGVLVRAGHTEASVDLCRLAGHSGTGVICEIARDDGEMARLPELLRFGAEHGFPVVAISDLIAYRRRREGLAERASEARIPPSRAGIAAVGSRDLLGDLDEAAAR
jgi:3,4-dihydroxy 2-butanone 4-phosphate synthase/GTP cyclohydrolase II